MSSEQDTTELSQRQEEEEEQPMRNLSVQRWNNVPCLQTNTDTNNSLEQQQIQQTNGRILVYFDDFLSKKQNTVMYPPERQYSFV